MAMERTVPEGGDLLGIPAAHTDAPILSGVPEYQPMVGSLPRSVDGAHHRLGVAALLREAGEGCTLLFVVGHRRIAQQLEGSEATVALEDEVLGAVLDDDGQLRGVGLAGLDEILGERQQRWVILVQ
jgi:hypothetical protein